MKKLNLDGVTAMDGTFAGLPAGGYVCKFGNIADEPVKEYLKIEYDIAEGEYKGYYQDLWDSKAFWGGTLYKSYKDSALGFFKHFTNCIEASNKPFIWNDDETKLRGKQIGLVLSEEEYENREGAVKTRLYVSAIKTVEDIRKGLYKIADKKLLNSGNKSNKKTSELTPVDDDLLPF